MLQSVTKNVTWNYKVLQKWLKVIRLNTLLLYYISSQIKKFFLFNIINIKWNIFGYSKTKDWNWLMVRKWLLNTSIFCLLYFFLVIMVLMQAWSFTMDDILLEVHCLTKYPRQYLCKDLNTHKSIIEQHLHFPSNQ